MSGVPVLQDEVNRKAFDALSYLTTAVHHHKITPEQFSTGVDVLFLAVSGLVTDPDFIHIITEAQGLIDQEKKHATRRAPQPATEVIEPLEGDSRSSFGDW